MLFTNEGQSTLNPNKVVRSPTPTMTQTPQDRFDNTTNQETDTKLFGRLSLSTDTLNTPYLVSKSSHCRINYLTTFFVGIRYLVIMQRMEKDATPAEEWLQSLHATCNRLSTQYCNLLKAASSSTALSEHQDQYDQGIIMTNSGTTDGTAGGTTAGGGSTGRQHHNPRGMSHYKVEDCPYSLSCFTFCLK